MKQYNIIVGLDIGSSKIRSAICEINTSGELNLLEIGSSISFGLSKGLIEDPAELSKALERSITRATYNKNIKPSYVITNIPFYGIQSFQNMGFILCKDQSGQIREYEKIECIRRAKNIIKAPDQRVLHVIPLCFKVDGNIIQNPVGAFGNNLEVQTHIILGNSDNISGLNYAIKDLNLHICGIVYDVLANAQVSLTEEERKKGALLIDIGSRFTKIGIFENNLLQNSVIIPIGGETITSDIAYCLKSSIPEAERIKILHRQKSNPIDIIEQKEKFHITTKNNERQEIEKDLLWRIIDARLKELFNIMKEKISLKASHPYQIVLTGGSSSIASLENICKEALNLPVRTGLPENIQSIIETPDHSSAVGLVVYGLKTGAIPFPQPKPPTLFSRINKKLRDFF